MNKQQKQIIIFAGPMDAATARSMTSNQ